MFLISGVNVLREKKMKSIKKQNAAHLSKKHCINTFMAIWEKKHCFSWLMLPNTCVHFDPDALLPCLPVTPAREATGAEKHTPAVDKTLWSLNNSLKNSHQADITTYVISESTHGCVFYPTCSSQEGGDGALAINAPPACHVLAAFTNLLLSLFFFLSLISSPHWFWHHGARSLCLVWTWMKRGTWLTDSSPTHRPQNTHTILSNPIVLTYMYIRVYAVFLWSVTFTCMAAWIRAKRQRKMMELRSRSGVCCLNTHTHAHTYDDKQLERTESRGAEYNYLCCSAWPTSLQTPVTMNKKIKTPSLITRGNQLCDWKETSRPHPHYLNLSWRKVPHTVSVSCQSETLHPATSYEKSIAVTPVIVAGLTPAFWGPGEPISSS